MLKTHPRASELTINTDIAAFTITNNQLFNEIIEHIDLETITNHELREIFFIVRKQLTQLNWKELVSHSIGNLPFGLNQTLHAWDGFNPCGGCPDALLEGEHCYHKHNCKAWEIYTSNDNYQGDQS